jgi:hypothetical protein
MKTRGKFSALAMVAIASCFAGSVATAGQRAEAQWDAVFRTTPTEFVAAEEAAVEPLDLAADISAWMQPLGLRTSINEDGLRLSGVQSFDDMRSVLFDDA